VNGYTRYDLSANYQVGRWSFLLNLRNVTDENYIEASSARLAVRPGAPRNLLAQLQYRF